MEHEGSAAAAGGAAAEEPPCSDNDGGSYNAERKSQCNKIRNM